MAVSALGGRQWAATGVPTTQQLGGTHVHHRHQEHTRARSGSAATPTSRPPRGREARQSLAFGVDVGSVVVNEPLLLPIPREFLDQVRALVAAAVRDELAARLPLRADGLLDVNGAAAYLSSTPAAIRALVKRDAIPYHKAPNGRLLFDRDELDQWARTG